MARRTFTATVRVLVRNEDTCEMVFNVADLTQLLEDNVSLDLGGDTRLDDGSHVVAIEIDWDTLKEVK